MAQKTIVHLTDDLDGSEATQTVEFGYQGKTYKLDLSDQNASELEEALAPYIAAGIGDRGAANAPRPASPGCATRGVAIGRSCCGPAPRAVRRVGMAGKRVLGPPPSIATTSAADGTVSTCLEYEWRPEFRLSCRAGAE